MLNGVTNVNSEPRKPRTEVPTARRRTGSNGDRRAASILIFFLGGVGASIVFPMAKTTKKRKKILLASYLSLNPKNLSLVFK